MTVRTLLAGRWGYIVLGMLALAFRIGTAIPIQRAGYMDASYTLHIAENLAQGRGFVEQVLWNYLDGPTKLPHPSNLYWMPLPPVLASASFILFGASYHAAQLPFVLLSSIPPLFAYYLSRRVSSRIGLASGEVAPYGWMAALLVTFGGFYAIYWVAPDNLTPFAVSTDSALLFMAIALQRDRLPGLVWFAAGCLAGLSQLARADGFLVLAVVPIALCLSRRSPVHAAMDCIFAASGFLLVLAPWLARNYAAIGTFLAPGGVRTLFLTSYDDLFRYNVTDLTLSGYIDWGGANIVASKLNALGFDLLVLIFGGMQIFLAPFAAIGLWRLKGTVEFRLFLLYALLLTLAMAFIFTFPGIRGSMLHSSAALVPYFAVAVGPGLDASIRWVSRHRRRWDERSARVFFRRGFVALACGLTLFLYSQAVFGLFAFGPPTMPVWNARDEEYAAIGQQLEKAGVSALQPVMTVDPPSFFNETKRRSIYLPTDGLDAVFQAARQFGAHYLVLENDHPVPLNSLYAGRVQVTGLKPVANFQDALGRPVVLYEIGNRGQ
jgi:hypothetical protein